MKKILSVCFAVMITVLSAACSSKTEDTFSISEEVKEAREELYNKFLAEDRMFSFPDYYAGEYISSDGQALVVQFTAENTPDFDFLLDEFDCVKFKQVKYSESELFNLADICKDEMDEKFPEIKYFGAYPDAEKNAVVIEVPQDVLNNQDLMSDLNNYFSNQPIVFILPNPIMFM